MSSEVETSKYSIASEYPGVSYFDDEVREGFFVSSMMKRYWAAQIKVLSEIDKVCRKHGIRWFADCGTLLGAVRHGGMIPWDDDMDICMLRKDWLRFFDVAKKELPNSYSVLSIQLEPEYENVIGRVVNSHAINYSEEHLKEFFGCPYTVGVDIFPLDDLSENEEHEEHRRSLASDVSNAYAMIESGRMNTQDCRSLLAKIESDNHISLHRSGNLLRELRLLTEKIYMMYSSDEAKYVAGMPFWVVWHDHKYSKELYKNTLYLPFEYIKIPVPAGYEEVLRTVYGDYLTVRKGGGAHEYPVYREQEDMLKIRNNGNPFRFTMTGKAIDSIPYKKTTEEKCIEIADLLLQVHSHIDGLVAAGDADTAVTLLNKCQTLAISLGTLIEKRMSDGEKLVGRLEDYCELVFESSEAWSDKSIKLLDYSIKETKEAIKAYFESKKKEVLFIVTKSKWWSSISFVYDHYREMRDTEVYVMPVSYNNADKVIGINGMESNDRNLLPTTLNIVNSDEYDIAKRNPDVIVTSYPYDGWGSTVDIPEFFYSENLELYTDELIYVPCFETDLPINENDKATTSIRIMLEQPAVLYSDYIIVRTNEIRECYIDSLSSISGHKDYWIEKIHVVENAQSKECGFSNLLPDEWRNKIHGRKVLIFGVSGSFIMENGKRSVNKLKEAMQTISEASEHIACIYSAGEDVDCIEKINPELWREYSLFIESISDSENVIIDSEQKVSDCLINISGYYGTPGVLAHRCRNLKKPVMLMKIL